LPYIKEEDKKRFEKVTEELRRSPPTSPGDLNYLFSMISKYYLESRGEIRYQYLNDVLGALNGASLEFNRRVVAPYEDLAIKKNGDI